MLSGIYYIKCRHSWISRIFECAFSLNKNFWVLAFAFAFKPFSNSCVHSTRLVLRCVFAIILNGISRVDLCKILCKCKHWMWMTLRMEPYFFFHPIKCFTETPKTKIYYIRTSESIQWIHLVLVYIVFCLHLLVVCR